MAKPETMNPMTKLKVPNMPNLSERRMIMKQKEKCEGMNCYHQYEEEEERMDQEEEESQKEQKEEDKEEEMKEEEKNRPGHQHDEDGKENDAKEATHLPQTKEKQRTTTWQNKNKHNDKGFVGEPKDRTASSRAHPGHPQESP